MFNKMHFNLHLNVQLMSAYIICGISSSGSSGFGQQLVLHYQRIYSTCLEYSHLLYWRNIYCFQEL